MPGFLSRLGIGEGVLGTLIVTFGVGAMIAMPISGQAVARIGSGLVLRVAWPALGLFLPLPFVVSHLPTAYVGMLLFGGAVGALDVAMNANAVAVERYLGRPILSSCHGFWSIGGVIGSAFGGFLLAFSNYEMQSAVACLFCILIFGVFVRRILADPPKAAAQLKSKLSLNPSLFVLGVMALFAMAPEGSVLDWSGVYLQRDLGAEPFFSGAGFAAFASLMTLSRFTGDHLRARFGPYKLLLASCGVAAMGLLGAGLAPTAVVAVFAFGIAGAGFANILPILYSIASNIDGLNPGVAVSTVTFTAYSGLLLAPAIIGFSAQHAGFTAVFGALSVLPAVIFAASLIMEKTINRKQKSNG